MSTITAAPGVGPLLRDWRQRRRLSQLDLALKADVSSRHISFVETGRSRPSAEMVKHIAEVLEVPLRDRNPLLLAAGFAPAYAQTDLDDPTMAPARAALERVLAAHEPFPAVVVDGHWGLVSANASLQRVIDGVAQHLLEPPVNVLRLSLHPDGLGPRIINYDEWRSHVLGRLGRQAAQSRDLALATLADELASYSGARTPGPSDIAASAIATPLRLATNDGELAFISTVTVFGAPADVTVAELAIESFYPVDAHTAAVLSGASDWSRAEDTSKHDRAHKA